MFIDFLTKEEQLIYLSFADEIIKVDGLTCEEELKKIKGLTLKITGGLDYKLKETEPSKITKKETRRIFLMGLIGIAHVDGKYCDEEKAYIKELAKKFGISSELETMEKWVLEMVNHSGKGVEMIYK